MTFANRYPAIDDLRTRAKRRIPHFVWEYLDSGTGADVAMSRNREALDSILFRQTIMKGKIEPDLRVSLFGRTYLRPFGIAPVGSTGMMWPGAEHAFARVAVEAGIPYTLSTVATRTPEEIGPMAEGNGWFQLYALGDPEKQRDLVRRARESGFSVLVLTVDVPLSSRRERQRKAGFTMPPKITPKMVWQAAQCPAWLMGIRKWGMPRFQTLAGYIPEKNLQDVTRRIASDLHPPMGWDIIDRLREDWTGPLVLKGLQNGADAAEAKARGVDGVWVSNHGGRQVDAARPSIACLPEVRAAVGPDYPVLFDSGVRSGLDIARALALGADMAMLGRGFIYAAGALGDAGPAHAVEILEDDLRNAMGQIGAATVTDLSNAVEAAHFPLEAV